MRYAPQALVGLGPRIVACLLLIVYLRLKPTRDNFKIGKGERTGIQETCLRGNSVTGCGESCKMRSSLF